MQSAYAMGKGIAIGALVLGLSLLAASVQAAVPYDLSNFGNEYVCDTTTLIVRPKTVADVQAAVARYPKVRGNGKGHSWNRPFFCANTSSASDGPAVNIQLSTLRPLSIQVLEDESAVWVDAGIRVVDLLQYLADYVTRKSPTGYTLGAFPWYVYQSVGGAVSTGTHGSSLVYNSLSNQVLELEMVVANGTLVRLTPETHPFLMKAARVSVGRLGIITRIKFRIVKEQPVRRELRVMSVTQFLSLLQSAQQQYTTSGVMPPELNETEWFWQTQRSQILMVSFLRSDTADLDPSTQSSILAKWTPDSTTIYNTSMELLKSVSRIEDLPIKSSVTYDQNGVATGAAATIASLLQNTINAALPNFPLGKATDDSTSTTSGTGSASVVKGLTEGRTKRVAQRIAAFSGFGASKSEGAGAGNESDHSVAVTWPEPVQKPINILYGQTGSAVPLMDANRVGVEVIARNATLESRKAYLAQPEALEVQIKGVLYDQYEVSVPVSSMFDCVKGMMDLMYGSDLDSQQVNTITTDKGFRSAPLMRLVGKEDGFLSQTEDGPRLFFNIEDYLYYNGGRKASNAPFKKVVGYLRSNPACGKSGLTGAGGRLHWGKAGWPDEGCWRGDVEYPDTWCDFGCAVRTLDPTDKFIGSAPDRFTWEGVDLAGCCGPNGFDKTKPGCVCKVKHARSVESCPPAPYYTNR